MRLELATPFLSIRALGPVELPAFTVITGENGTGKTHLLQAIAGGACRVDDLDPRQIRYFDYGSFTLENPSGMTITQIEQVVNKNYQEFQNRWLPHASRLFNRWVAQENASLALNDDPSIGTTPVAELLLGIENIWSDHHESSHVAEIVQRYKTAIENDLFRNESIHSGVPQPQELIRCLKKIGKPVHTVSIQDLRNHFVPRVGRSELFGLSLGALFSKYKIDEFRWCHDEFEAGRGGSIKALRATFRRKNPRPWLLINRLLDTMGDYCVSDQIFKFRVTNPDDIELKLSDYTKFSFAPKLINRSNNAQCDFASLSSGEKTLLALALSIYGATDGYDLPKLLLLDEIDASLHPSMISAMLFAIETAFLTKGVSVILATHSPTTVALSPPDSIRLMCIQGANRKIVNTEKTDAISVLSEGLVTLDEGLKIASSLKNRLNILTEGHNVGILKRYFRLAGIKNVNFIEGLEDRTGKDQLRSYFELFSVIDDKRVLVIWDCDADSVARKLKETDHVFKFVLPQQDNEIARSGIENMFSIELLEKYTVEVKTKSTGVIKVRFDQGQKSQFAEMIMSKAKLKDFALFATLREKVLDIQRSQLT